MARLSNAGCVAAIQRRDVFDNNNSTMQGRRTFVGWGDVAERDRPIGSITSDTYVDTEIDYWVYSYDTPIAWVFKNGDMHIPPLDPFTTSTSTQTHRALLLEAVVGVNSGLRISAAGKPVMV